MIQRSHVAVEAKDSISLIPAQEDWKTLLKQSRISTRELLQAVGLDQHPLVDEQAESLFELRVPGPYLDKIEKGNPNDPLLLQVLPQGREFDNPEGYTTDPLEEQQFSPLPGVIHKYRSRVLLIATRACAIHCRYCFRRHFPYDEHRHSQQDWQPALDYIRSQPDVNEVILSGGDPLVMSNAALKNLLNELDALPGLKRIRIHSRLATSLPQRVDQSLLQLMESLKKQVILVIHCNHPRELGPDVAKALRQLKQAGVVLLNQSVLLRKVNDCPFVLAELSEALFEHNVLPYYLFTLDPVSGSAHFDLEREKVCEVYRQLLGRVPGFLVPRLVSEYAGQSSKTPVDLGLTI
ncbi:MAG: EF-P beta-lysylation protein EpmB [Oleiphilus sp.]|nr:MAG: EF-P beta-lysylation protein EpmB [Oleiphilus sp.]